MIKAFHPTWSGFRTVGRIYPNGELWQVHANGTPVRLVGELGARGTIIEIKGSLRVSVGILRVKVTGIHVDMRSGSSKGFSIIGRLRRGEKIEVEGYENGWFQISREDGLTGWIPASQVRTEVESNVSYDSPFLSSFLPKGEIQAVWVEHNVEENWRNGMRIHVKFTLDNSFQSECTAVVFFYSADGRPVKDFNREYCTTDGDVALPRTFTPEYESLLASDFTLFMPYDELHMVYGRHELKFKVMLHRSDVGFIAESAFQNFFYQK